MCDYHDVDAASFDEAYEFVMHGTEPTDTEWECILQHRPVTWLF